MSNESDMPERESTDAGPLAGQRLAKARKAREISIFDIAKELHLDEYKVQALEENRFDVLGAPVFAKGHLRKYAELVGVSTDDIMADYYSLNRSAGAPPVVGLPRKNERNWQLGPWILAGVVLVAVLGAIYWWLGRPPAPAGGDAVPDASGARLAVPATRDEAAAPASGPTTAAAPSDIGDTGADTGTDDSADDAAAVETEPAAAPQPAAEAPPATPPATPPAPGQVRLSMEFSGDCWTEVSDASGARLFFDLGRAGRTLNVSGEPPLRVLFGNSDNVTVRVDGQDFPITAAMRRGQTARLTINKP